MRAAYHIVMYTVSNIHSKVLRILLIKKNRNLCCHYNCFYFIELYPKKQTLKQQPGLIMVET